MVKAITTRIHNGEVLSSSVSVPYSFAEAQDILTNQYKARRKSSDITKITKNNRMMSARYKTGLVVTIQLVHA